MYIWNDLKNRDISPIKDNVIFISWQVVGIKNESILEQMLSYTFKGENLFLLVLSLGYLGYWLYQYHDIQIHSVVDTHLLV